jgi:hypothetical protein
MQKRRRPPRKKAASRGARNGLGLTHRIFGESFYENLKALMDDQIAEMMRDPEFRRTVQEFNVRMFRLMTSLAEKQMGSRRLRLQR